MVTSVCHHSADLLNRMPSSVFSRFTPRCRYTVIRLFSCSHAGLCYKDGLQSVLQSHNRRVPVQRACLAYILVSITRNVRGFHADCPSVFRKLFTYKTPEPSFRHVFRKYMPLTFVFSTSMLSYVHNMYIGFSLVFSRRLARVWVLPGVYRPLEFMTDLCRSPHAANSRCVGTDRRPGAGAALWQEVWKTRAGCGVDTGSVCGDKWWCCYSVPNRSSWCCPCLEGPWSARLTCVCGGWGWG